MNGSRNAQTMRVLTVLSLMGVIGCRDEAQPAPPRIEGRVLSLTDPDAPRGALPRGEPLDGVRVTLEDRAAQSGGDGHFTLDEVPRGERLLLRFEREGYAPITVPVRVGEGVDVVSVDVAMVPREPALVWAANGATLSRGAVSLEIRPASFVDARGRPVDGEVEVYFTPVLPNSEGGRGTPGDLTAYDSSWEVRPLQSLLMLELSAEQGGERVYLSEAARLTVDVQAAGIELPAGWETRMEQGIPFWSFGDELGRWVESNLVRFEGSPEAPQLVVEIPGVEMGGADWRFRCAPDQICLDGSSGWAGEEDEEGGDTGGMNVVGGTSAGPTNVTMSAAQTRSIGAPARCTFTNTAPFVAACNYFCTGTVISDSHVLTAAHCVDDQTNGGTVNNLGFVLGPDITAGNWEGVLQVSRVDWDARYDGSGGTSTRQGRDTAVLTLANPVSQAGLPITPMPLLSRDLDNDDVGRLIEMVGYGRTGGSGTGGRNRNWLGSTIGGVTEFTVLPVTTSTGTVCFGDSGGPLLLEEGGVVYQIGVTSTVQTTNQSTVCVGNATYGAIDVQLDWITGVVGAGNFPAVPVASMPGSYGPPPQWFNIDMFGQATGVQGDVVDAVNEPLSGAYVSMWTEEGPDGHTYTYTDADGHFSVWPVNANVNLAISAAVTLSGGRATSSSSDVVYGGIDAWESPDPTPREPISAYGTIDPNPIVIPICTVAGELTLANIDDPATGQILLGSAFFWDNDDERVPCVEPAEEFYVDECELRPRDAASGGTEGFSTQWQPDAELESIGQQVTVRGGQSSTLTLARTDGDSGPFYAGTLTSGISAFMQGPFQVTAGAFTTQAVLDPDAPALTGTWRVATGTRTLASSRSVTWTPQGSADEVLFLSLVPDDPSGEVLHCAMRNDGSFTLPQDLVTDLPSGGYTAAFYYESRGYAAIGDGTAARLRAVSVTQRDARR